MAWYDLFVGKRGNITDNSSQSDTIEDLNTIKENTTDDIIREVKIIEDGRVGSFFDGSIESIHSKQSISEGKVNLSPSNLQQLLGNDDTNALGQVIDGIRGDYSLSDIFLENEEMSKDSVIGAAMEILADDSCTVDETTHFAIMVDSTDEGLKKFIEDFLRNNINIEDRLWSWVTKLLQ